MKREPIHFWDIGPGYYICEWYPFTVYEYVDMEYDHRDDGQKSTILFKDVASGDTRIESPNTMGRMVKATEREVKEALLRSIK